LSRPISDQRCAYIIKIVTRYKIVQVSPKEIDDAVFDKKGMNLNWLEAVKSAEISNDLKPERLILDCPSVNIEAYKDYVDNLLTVKPEIVCEHKADTKYISVAAASILAKVTRDRAIEKMKETYGALGSGYPADPTTKAFLEHNWDRHPEIFRKSWACYKKMVKNKLQKNLGEF